MQTVLAYHQKLFRRIKIHREAAIITLKGRLSGDTVVDFNRQLNYAVLSNRHSSLMVNMERVDWLDSAGLMVLVRALKLARNANKRFLVCSVSQPVRMILELTRLDQVMEIMECPIS